MTSKVIRVVVNGAAGRMGREVMSALCQDSDMEPVGAVDIKASEDFLSLPDGSGLIPYSSDLKEMITRSRPQVIVDFTEAGVALASARNAIPSGVNVVIGSTGLTQKQLDEIEALTWRHDVGTLIAPNFALGAVLLSHLARISAQFFDYVEIIEAHHEAKIDAPSGTAQAIARSIVSGAAESIQRPMPIREPVTGTRGGALEDVTIHSMRLPGRMAHHEVVFAAQGQTLSLKHDTINRECYIPGVTRAIHHVVNNNGFTVGLEEMLGLT